MSDVDRLRAAADRLEEPGDLGRCSDPYECCIHADWQGYPDPSNLPTDPRDHATATLLRVVAAEVPLVEDYGQGWLSRTWNTALALADSILGVSDE